MRETQNHLKTTLIVACDCLDLLRPLCSGQQLDVPVAIIRSATGHFMMLNKLYTCSAKCQVSDLTNLLSKPSLVLPQINTPLPLTQQALGLCCIAPVSQWPVGKLLHSGDSGQAWGEGGRTGDMCVCLSVINRNPDKATGREDKATHGIHCEELHPHKTFA